MMRIIYVHPIFKFLNTTDNPIDIHNDERTDKLMDMSDDWICFLRKVSSTELEVTFSRVTFLREFRGCYFLRRDAILKMVQWSLEICGFAGAFIDCFFDCNPPFFDRYWHNIARCSLKAFLPHRWDHNCFHEDSNTFFNLYPQRQDSNFRSTQ